MPVTNSSFGEKTLATDVASSFASQVKGRIVLITGPNLNGIGGSTSLALASQSPRMLILVGRSPNKLEETTKSIKGVDSSIIVKTITASLGSPESCKKAAQKIMDDSDIPQIDIVLNNAGTMCSDERKLTAEGIEEQFATNYLGHFILTNGIMPKILESAKNSPKGSTRIVNVSSSECSSSPIRFSDINLNKPTKELPEAERPKWDTLNGSGVFENGVHTGRVGYAQSKTANVLFSVELNELLFEKYGVVSVSLHPGGISTEIAREMDPKKLQELIKYFNTVGVFFKTLDQGASTTLTAALDPMISPSDIYLNDCQVAETPKWCSDLTAAGKLWKLGEQYAGQTFAY